MGKDRFKHFEVGDFVEITFSKWHKEVAIVTGFRQGKCIMYVRIAGEPHDRCLSPGTFQRVKFVGRGDMAKILYN